jgi:hypothetical protein
MPTRGEHEGFGDYVIEIFYESSKTKRIGTSTQLVTGEPSIRAGRKCQLSRTVRAAESSNTANPEERANSTAATLPSPRTCTRRMTIPCAPKRRAIIGYGGLGFTL